MLLLGQVTNEIIELAGCVLTNEQDDILLLHRSTDAYDHWEIPGGKTEKGEKLETAAIREIEEELGVKVRIIKLLGSEVFEDGGRNFRYSWFDAKIIDDEAKIMEPETFVGLKHFSLEAMNSISLSAGVKTMLGLIETGEIEL